MTWLALEAERFNVCTQFFYLPSSGKKDCGQEKSPSPVSLKHTGCATNCIHVITGARGEYEAERVF